MSTDRKLLELAAKAAGYSVTYKATDCYGHKDGNFYFGVGTYTPTCWSPLTDDGDALRLAVKLRIDIYLGRRGAVLAISQRGAVYDESESDDPHAASRRAIVRAAAEIGKAMP